MSGANHIVGGTVFTGIFASFWNINVFEKPEYLFFTAFFSILPDVDHLKSPIGKLFYPIAKWLYIKYGHRTITHSLIFFLSAWLLIYFLESVTPGGNEITLIFAFAFFSHLLFDMMTKQGIPLLWPFMRNPCVIPGNPELRLKSSHLQTEAICFAIFILLGITCQPLFAQGFWTSYNKAFNDLKHLHQENKQSETLVSVKVQLMKNGNISNDEGLLIHSTESKAVIFNGRQFLELNNEMKIITITPTRTKQHLTTTDLLFFNITPDSLKDLIKNKPILQLKLQSTSTFSFIKDNKPSKAASADLEYQFNPVMAFLPDSVTNKLVNQMEILKYELQKTQNEKRLSEKSRHDLQYRIDQLTSSIHQMDLYEREKAVQELTIRRKELESIPANQDDTGKLQLRINQLQEEMRKSHVRVSGYLQYLIL